MLRVQDLELRFADGRKVCIPPFQILPGNALAVVGGNATGKSTLLRVLAGLEAVPPGVVELVADTRLGLIPTDLRSFLFPWYSASTNLALFESAGRTTTLLNSEHFGAQWAALLGRESCSRLLTTPICKLSSGERASLALLCLLVRPPDLILLDELFANASAKTGQP